MSDAVAHTADAIKRHNVAAGAFRIRHTPAHSNTAKSENKIVDFFIIVW